METEKQYGIYKTIFKCIFILIIQIIEDKEWRC